jgi:hypothetical protein
VSFPIPLLHEALHATVPLQFWNEYLYLMGPAAKLYADLARYLRTVQMEVNYAVNAFHPPKAALENNLLGSRAGCAIYCEYSAHHPVFGERM